MCTPFIWLLSHSVNILRFTHVAVCITGSFSFAAEQHSIVYIYNNLLIHSPVYGTLSSFQFAYAMYLMVELLDYRVGIC